MKKVAIFFANSAGHYYIEVVTVFEGEDIPKTDHKFVVAKVVDESKDWRLFEETRAELANPTTKAGQVLVVVQRLGGSE